MKSIKIIIFIVSCLAVGLSLPIYAEDYKIGIVNTVKVLEESPQAAVADTLIKKEFSSKDRKLVTQQKKVKAMQDRLDKDGAVMSEAERKKLEKDIRTARRNLKRDQDEFREDVNFRFNEERAKIQKEVFQAIQKIAKQNNFDLILYDGVAYAGQKVDISDLIIKYLKENQAKPSTDETKTKDQ